MTGRYWYNTAHWINSEREDALWRQYWDMQINLMPGRDFIFKVIFHQGYKEEEVLYRDGILIQGEFCPHPYSFLLAYQLDRDHELEGIFGVHKYRMKVGLKNHIWSTSVEGGFSRDDFRVQEWSLEPVIKKNHRPGRYSRLVCPMKALPGYFTVIPQWEEALKIGSFTMKAKTGYEFQSPREKEKQAESYILRLQLEWNH